MTKVTNQATHKALNEQGQTFVEYMLLLFIVSSMALLIFKAMDRFNLTQRLMDPLQKGFAAQYRYGSKETKGPEDGDAEKHPRVPKPLGVNFKMFINPKKRR